MRMILLASIFLGIGLPAGSAPVLTQTGVEQSTNAQTRTSGDSIFTTNANFYLPIYTSSPSPSSVTGARLQSGLIHFYSGGSSYVTFQTTNGGRLVGTQRIFNNPSGTAEAWSNFVSGTLNHAIWTNYMVATNGKSNPVWSNRTPGSAAWNSANLLTRATNYNGVSFSWEGELSAGQIQITAISPWIGYARGHGMGGDSTNTSNAGKKVYFVTTANAQITNTIAEQITQENGSYDFTMFRFSAALPATIYPFPVLDRLEYDSKAPSSFSGAPYTIFRWTQSNAFITDVSPFTGAPVDGDSGGAVLKMIADSLHFYGGVTTSGWTVGMSNCCVELLNRGGVSLAAGMPVKTSLLSYPTP